MHCGVFLFSKPDKSVYSSHFLTEHPIHLKRKLYQKSCTIWNAFLCTEQLSIHPSHQTSISRPWHLSPALCYFTNIVMLRSSTHPSTKASALKALIDSLINLLFPRTCSLFCSIHFRVWFQQHRAKMFLTRGPDFPEDAQIKDKSQAVVHDCSELSMTNYTFSGWMVFLWFESKAMF